MPTLPSRLAPPTVQFRQPPTTSALTESQQSRAKEKQEQRDENYRTFSDLYQHFGLAAINDVYAGKERVFNCRNVIDKMEKASGENLSCKEKDGTNLLDRMKITASQQGLKYTAEAMSEDGKSKPLSDKPVYLGLGMTTAQVQQLHALSKGSQSANAIKAGRFLSTDKERETEVNSAKKCTKDQKQVLLEIKGSSNKSLRPHQGGSNPLETLFGPHATFKVTAVGPGSKNKDLIIVQLTEIPVTKNTVPLLP